MMFIHLVGGFAVVGLAIAAGVVSISGRPVAAVAPLAGWALGLLVVQATTGMFLLTATEEGPGPLHILLPLIGLGAAGVLRLTRSGSQPARDLVLGAVYGFVALGAVVGLVTGLTAG